MVDYYNYAVSLRRQLHARPEVGWCEFWTTALIVEELEALGWTVHMGKSHLGRMPLWVEMKSWFSKT